MMVSSPSAAVSATGVTVTLTAPTPAPKLTAVPIGVQSVPLAAVPVMASVMVSGSARLPVRLTMK